MRRRKTDALNARHVMYGAQQVGECVCAAAAAVLRQARQVAAIGVDVLPQQCNLLIACAAGGRQVDLQAAGQRGVSRVGQGNHNLP